MSEYVTVQMKPRSAFMSAISLLPKNNPLSRLASVDKIYLKDLGLRELNNPALLAGQALYIENWDGVTAPIDVRDLLLGNPIYYTANKGRIKFFLTDEVQRSVEYGMIKKYVDAGLFIIEGYSSDVSGTATLELKEVLLTFPNMVPPDTAINIQTGAYLGGPATIEGDLDITLNASGVAFVEDAGLQIYLSGQNLEKAPMSGSKEVYWVSSTQVALVRRIRLGQSLKVISLR